MSKHTPGLFRSADGSTRCRGCHLHPDMCTCRREHPMWKILRGVCHGLETGGRAAIAKAEEGGG